jgi:predicted phosphodiesterase
MRQTLISVFILFFFNAGFCQVGQEIRIGILTDVQYCDCAPNGKRYYTLSLQKLDSCISLFNANPLDGVFHLGDMIDRGFGSFDSVVPRFRKFDAPTWLVLGNHDFMVRSRDGKKVLERVGLKDAFYKVDLGEWTLLVLNGNDLSCFAPQTKKQRKERNVMLAGLFSGLQPNGMPWNGGIGSDQMVWLEDHLRAAETEGRKIVVMCHFPLFSKGNHNLFNNRELFELLSGYSSVKAYFSGHYHAGHYQELNGIHLVNFKGMVDTKVNACAILTLTPDSILIRGYGREPDRNLKIRE